MYWRDCHQRDRNPTYSCCPKQFPTQPIQCWKRQYAKNHTRTADGTNRIPKRLHPKSNQQPIKWWMLRCPSCSNFDGADGTGFCINSLKSSHLLRYHYSIALNSLLHRLPLMSFICCCSNLSNAFIAVNYFLV